MWTKLIWFKTSALNMNTTIVYPCIAYTYSFSIHLVTGTSVSEKLRRKSLELSFIVFTFLSGKTIFGSALIVWVKLWVTVWVTVWVAGWITAPITRTSDSDGASDCVGDRVSDRVSIRVSHRTLTRTSGSDVASDRVGDLSQWCGRGDIIAAGLREGFCARGS